MYLRILLFLLFFVLLPPPVQAAEDRDEPRILILHSYHLDYSWTQGVIEGMERVLALHPEIGVHVEFMDTKRFHDPTYLTSLLEIILSHKFEKISFDLVLLSDNDAFDFVLRHRNELFLGAPVVFCGINGFEPEMIAGVEDITGVAEIPDYRGTLDFALRHHPERQHVVVIGNTRNETDRWNRRLLLETIPEFDERARFEHWDDWPLNRLIDGLEALGDESIVLINGLITDEAGVVFSFPESTERLYEATATPLYALWGHYFPWIVGGHIVSPHQQGYLAAQMGVRILAGESPGSMPVIVAGADEWIFQYEKLKRFGISVSSLPPGSIVLNTPPPFFTMTPREAWMAAVVAFSLLLTITVLAISMMRGRQVQRELRDSEDRFRAIAHYTYDWESWVAPDGRLLWVNPSVECYTGFSVAECLEMSDYPIPIVHEDDREKLAGAMNTARREETTQTDFRIRIRRRDGTVRWMSGNWQPIRNSLGAYVGVRTSMRDVTEWQEAELKMRETNEELDAFVHTVSHDLRTPLTPILGFTELLQRDYGPRLDDQGRELLTILEEQGKRMNDMLEDLLELSRAGYLEQPSEPVDANEVVNEILADLRPRVLETGAEIRVGTLPEVFIHKAYMTQALENLIANAIRYAGREGSPIEVEGGTSGNTVHFEIRDHGPGVSDPEKEHIFDLFYRGSESGGKSGTGVGLATVRRIAHRCGGRVWVEDTPGGGSTFFLELESRMPPGTTG
jgi:PAS domain S-box-containing protein